MIRSCEGVSGGCHRRPWLLMPMPADVTTMWTVAIWLVASVKVASQLPALKPITSYVAVGPCAFEVVTVAIVPPAGLHVSDSPKESGAGYGVSETVICALLLAP